MRGVLTTIRRVAMSLALAVFVCFGGHPVGAQELFESGSDPIAAQVDRLYVKGLQFLLKSQSPDGFWQETIYGKEPAVVGLAIVSMLAHGDDPNSGPYAGAIKRGLGFIYKQQSETGYIGRSMYNHGFATLALAEAYGVVLDDRLGPALTRAVRLILNAQSKNPSGAWRYSPESTDADTTVSGAQMVSLFAARNAGIAVPEEAIQKGLKYFISMQTSDGGFGYTTPVSPNGPRTAIGCLVFALAKEKQTKTFQSAFDYLKKVQAESSFQHYFLYYAAQAHFHASPEAWQSWNRANIRSLASSQTAEGSWDGQFGSTFSTAASLLSLALNYRYLPIYER